MDDKVSYLLLFCIVISIILFIISVYVVRLIFNIPGIVRLHKAQVRLLEQMAKTQGVDSEIVEGIITETKWETLD
jgi:hypothetical protein